MSVKIKICGITNVGDAIVAANSGADMIGFIFSSKSPRYVTPAKARKIISALSGAVTAVGVFVDSSVTEVTKIAKEAGLSAVQLHGGEDSEFVGELRSSLLGIDIIKAVRVKDDASLEGLGAYKVAAFLLDTYIEGSPGGTGSAFDWSLIKGKLVGEILIVAGGLNEHNVTEMIRIVDPYGVDASSSLESEPGKKDHRRVRNFIKRIREYEATSR